MSGPLLVVGASGFVGGSVAEVANRRGFRVLGTHHDHPAPHASAPYDFRRDDLRPILDEHGVETVVFAANVEQAVDIPFDRFESRVRRVVDACRDRRLVYLSSDAVFEGTDGPYGETDRREPTTAYGRRLVAFEDRVRELDDRCIVRPGYVFGVSRGDLDPRLSRTRDRLGSGETVERFDNLYKSPIAVSELADAVVSLATDDYCGVVHAGGPRTSVHRFHREGMRGLGVPTDGLVPTRIPERVAVPPDLSLQSDRLASLTGVEPSPVRAALESRAGE